MEKKAKWLATLVAGMMIVAFMAPARGQDFYRGSRERAKDI